MQNIAVINTCIAGSTGKIASGLSKYLKELEINSFFCYGREDGQVEDNYYRIGTNGDLLRHALLTRLFGLQGFGSRRATKKLIKFLTSKSVDTVFIVSLHGYYLNEKMFLDYLGSKNINTVYVMIDEYAFLGKCPYNNDCENYKTGCKKCPQSREYPKNLLFSGSSQIYEMKKKAYSKIKNLIFVGPEYVIKKAKTSPLVKNKRFEVLDEAVDTEFYTPKETENLRKKLGIDNKATVLVCIAKYSVERKGCRYFVELARRFENDIDYVFVHVGFDKDVKEANLPKNYIPIPYVSDQEELAQYYSLGDLFVYPSLQDTMPNTCLEALSAGTPLLCFDISGMPYIGDDTVAKFVEAENVDQMEQYVKSIRKKDAETVNVCRQYAVKRYNNGEYFGKLHEIAKNNSYKDE